VDILKAIESRRAVKHYDPEFKMDEKDIKKLFDYALLSPSSFNIQHCRYVIVEDEALRSEIRAAAWDQAQVTEASILMVLCADVKAWNKNPDEYWRDAPKEVKDLMVSMIGPFYEGKEQLQRDEALRSVGISAQTIMLAAKEFGLDSCPMIGFDAEKVAELINLPEDHIAGMMIAVGKASKPANSRSGSISFDKAVIKNKF